MCFVYCLEGVCKRYLDMDQLIIDNRTCEYERDIVRTKNFIDIEHMCLVATETH